MFNLIRRQPKGCRIPVKAHPLAYPYSNADQAENLPGVNEHPNGDLRSKESVSTVMGLERTTVSYKIEHVGLENHCVAGPHEASVYQGLLESCVKP